MVKIFDDVTPREAIMVNPSFVWHLPRLNCPTYSKSFLSPDCPFSCPEAEENFLFPEGTYIVQAGSKKNVVTGSSRNDHQAAVKWILLTCISQCSSINSESSKSSQPQFPCSSNIWLISMSQ